MKHIFILFSLITLLQSSAFTLPSSSCSTKVFTAFQSPFLSSPFQMYMSSSLDIKSKLKDDMISAMKAKEKGKLAAVRAIQAAIKQYEVDERKDVDGSQAISKLF